MKTFLAVYTGNAASMEKSGWSALSEQQRQERQSAGREAWGRWVEANKSAIVAIGSPLGKTKRAAKDGISDTSNNLAAYTIVQAESHQAAAKLFENHPHFAIFPGDSVEIMECLPLPGA